MSVVFFSGIFLVYSWINCLDFRCITPGKWGKLASLILWGRPSLLPIYFLFKVDCQPSDNIVYNFRVPWGISPNDYLLRLQNVFAYTSVLSGQMEKDVIRRFHWFCVLCVLCRPPPPARPSQGFLTLSQCDVLALCSLGHIIQTPW